MNSSDLKSNAPKNFTTLEEDFNREGHDFTDFFDALRVSSLPKVTLISDISIYNYMTCTL